MLSMTTRGKCNWEASKVLRVLHIPATETRLDDGRVRFDVTMERSEDEMALLHLMVEALGLQPPEVLIHADAEHVAA